MNKVIFASVLLGALNIFAAPAEAHNKDRIKLVCNDGDCSLTAVSQGHGHGHHHHSKKTKIKFVGNVCNYKPAKNITVCRY